MKLFIATTIAKASFSIGRKFPINTRDLESGFMNNNFFNSVRENVGWLYLMAYQPLWVI